MIAWDNESWAGVGIGFLVAVAIAAVAGIARHWWTPRRVEREERSRRAAEQKLAAEERAAAEAQRQAEADRVAGEQAAALAAWQERIARLTKERVGARFLRRREIDEPGVIVTVLKLDERSPEARVLVREDAIDTPSSADVTPLATTSIEWRALTRDPDEQRHMSVFGTGLPDSAGWLQYEPLARESRSPD